jgi:hypothetical protein
LIAVLFNVNLQACALRHGFEAASGHELGAVRHFFSDIAPDGVDRLPASERSPACRCSSGIPRGRAPLLWPASQRL